MGEAEETIVSCSPQQKGTLFFGDIMRAHGIDFSKWALDWSMPENPPHPIDFVIQRVSWASYKDKRYDNHKNKIQQCPVRGAYHYYSSGVPWKQQADLFLSLLDSTYHMAWLDYETGYNKLTQRTSEDARRIVEYVADRFDGKVGVYANPNTVVNYLDKFGTWMLDWPFWVAHYWYIPSPDKSPGWQVGRVKMKRAEGSWQFWQYTEKGRAKDYGIVGKKAVDLDVFNGTIEELRQWLGESPEPPPINEQQIRKDERGKVIDEAIGKIETLRV